MINSKPGFDPGDVGTIYIDFFYQRSPEPALILFFQNIIGGKKITIQKVSD